MVKVSQDALRSRARALLVAMTERSRWVYALAAEGSFDTAQAIIVEAGFDELAKEADGRVRKYGDDDGHFVLFDNQELGAVLLEGEGDSVVPVIKTVLDQTGFVPQSKLWGDALAIGEDRAGPALRLLSHMAIGWDEDWTDLFVLHLASPDPIVRNDATLALTMAAMVSGESEMALELLQEAHKREKFPKLADTIKDAIRVIEAFRGDAIDVGALAPESSR